MLFIKKYFNPAVITSIVFLSILYVILFSYSTSPFYPYCYGGCESGGDSAHFMTVGKAWAMGKLPYRDMFDHKGPLIYFIDMLGFMLLGNRYGIAVLQILFLCITLSGIWCISQLERESKVFGVLVLVLSLIAMKANYVFGNTVEEYCLPFLSWSAFLLYRYFQEQRQGHNWMWATFYGITAGICLLTRATNAIPIVGGILIISVMLVIKREFANLAHNAIAFIGGFVITILPPTLYFLVNGCLSEAVFDILFFNIEYSHGMLPWYKNSDSNTIVLFLKSFFLFYCIFFAGLVYLAKKHWTLGIACITTGLMEAIVFMNNQAWGQYALVCLPQIALLLCAVRSAVGDEDSSVRLVGILFTCTIAMFMNMSFCERLVTARDTHKLFANQVHRDWATLIDRIPTEERDSFVAYGGNEIKDLYLITDTLPCYKFYMIQDFVSGFSNRVREEVKQTFDTGNAKWLLVDKESDTLDELLHRRYVLVSENERYGLYRLAGE